MEDRSASKRIRGVAQRAVSCTLVVALVTQLGVYSAGTAAVEQFPDGTEVEVTIDSPADGSSPIDGRAELTGTARVGAGDTPRDTSLVVVYDLSGSTLDPAGGDCGGDVNGDNRSNTILDCEVAAMIALEQSARDLGSVAEMGVTLFERSSAAADVQPATGRQPLTVPGADLNSNGVTDITEVVRTSRWTSGFFFADATVSLFTRLDAGNGNGGTNYEAGLRSACQTLAATSQPRRIIVFLSDGGSNTGANVTTALPCAQPATVYSVAVGANSTCSANPTGRGSLQLIADLTGGTCTEVISPEELPDILSGIIAPEIYQLTLSVNGGPEVDISDQTSVPLPAKGPAPLDWSATVDGLAGPEDEICVTVYARRDAENVTATECITLISDRPPVADAGPDQSVDEGSLVQLDGSASTDPDGDPLSYRWELVAQNGSPIVLSSATEPLAGFIAFDDGTYRFDLTVSDGRTEVTDSVTVNVGNVAPTASAASEPAAEGGVALVTASFTDPGILDTHTATIDWGDGTPIEDLPISAQGNGWGSLFGTHVYGDPGSFTATITITDDDGGVDVVQSVSVEVRASLAIWANSRTALRTVNWTGGTGVIEGLVHSNNQIRARGESKTFDGPVEYVGSISSSNAVVFSEPATQVAPADWPVRFEIADYRPGGRAAVDAGTSYFDMSAACGARWDPTGPLVPGLYYVPCDVKLNSSALTGEITIAAEGAIQVSGFQADFEPFIDGLLFISGSAVDKSIQISSNEATYLGYMFSELGRIDLAGAGNTYLCGLLGDRVEISDDELSIRASDCVRPERTVAPPSLVPSLDVAVDVTPAEVIPGDTADSAVTVTNTGSILLVPGVIGLENLGGQTVTVTGVDLGIEHLPVGGEWTRIAEPTMYASDPNPAPGVTYATTGDLIVGTTIAPDGLATWGAEIQAVLPAATVAQLLDPARTVAVRNIVEFTLDNPTGEPVRRLFRFGSDFAPDLRAIGGSLTDARVVASATDGSTVLLDAADEPALAELAPGASATVVVSAAVAVPAPRGVIEPVASYRARLDALDGTQLYGSAFALSTGGVGTVLGAFQSDTTTRRVPIVDLVLDGPEQIVAGDVATYGVELRNSGSAAAEALAPTLVIDGDAADVSALPARLTAGQIAGTTVDWSVPIDQPTGFIDADGAVIWADANGNPYGDSNDSVTTEVASPPDLSALLADTILVDADDSGLPSPGDTIRYLATITNRGSTPATGVGFVATPDPASDLLIGSVTTSAGTVTTGNAPGDVAVAVDVGTIAPMTSAEIAFDVVIPDPVPGHAIRLNVQGLVTSADLPDVLTDDPGESGLGDPTVTRIVDTPPSLQAILAARLVVDADDDGFVGPGDTLEYVAQITNSGLTAANDIDLTVTPDANSSLVVGSVEIVDATITSGNTPGDTSVGVNLVTLPGLSQSTIMYQVVVDDPLPAGTTQLLSQGTVTSTELPDLVTDDPTLPGSDDVTVVAVVTSTGGTGGGGGGGGGGPDGDGSTSGPRSTFDAVDPPDGEVVTAPIEITAGITPPPGTTIESWRVIAFPADGNHTTGIVLASGTGEPPAVLATFDPTVVSNGTWIIHVEATDSGGGVGVSETSVIVEGNLKLGRFAMTFEDASVSVAGIPIRVQRTYDTIARSSTEDYGYGWSLDVANFDVSTNRPLGEGPWNTRSCGAGFIFVPLCFSTDTPRRVSVTWPDGRVEAFDLKPTGNSFFRIFMTAKYESRPGTTSTLLPAPGDETGGLGGDGNMYDGAFGFGDIYDPQRFVLRAQDGTEYLLDSDTGLVSAEDRYGNTVTYTDAGIVSSLGASLTFTRDVDGRITKLTEPTGETVTYTYDAAGDLVSVVEQNAETTTFTYDTGHYLTVVDDAGPGPYRTMTYGPDGRLESITDAEGNTTAVDVDLDGRTQIVTAPDGNSTRLTSFDDRGNATTIDDVYDGESHVTTLAYDAYDKVTSRTDPLGNTWEATWSAAGNLTSYTDPNGATTTYEYGAFGLPTAITDGEGARRTFEYDSVGNLIAVNHPAGATNGGPVAFGSIAAIAGGRETFTHDSVGNVLTYTDAVGATWRWTYDPQGRVLTATDPLSQATSYTYDSSGRVLTETDETGAVLAYTYDGNGDVTSVTDGEGDTWTWTYDARGQVVAETDPLGRSVTYAYDDTGNLTSLTDATGRSTSWTYAYNRVVAITAGDGGATTYGYDSAGRLARITDPLGRVTNYAYDDANRWVSAEYPYGDGLRATASNVFDDSGWLVGVVDGRGERWSYQRDAVGRVTATTDPVGNRSFARFDALGRLIRTEDELGNATSYRYDAAGRLSVVTAPDGGATEFEYDLAGNRTAVVDPLAHRTTFGYDGAYRMTEAVDPAGNVTTTEYDSVGRVTSVTSLTGVTVDYEYDSVGDLVAMTDELGNRTSYTYDAEGRMLTRTDANGHTTTYSYDADGRQTSIVDALGGVVEYEWNLANELIGVTDANGDQRLVAHDDSGLVSAETDALGRTWSYSYDPVGQLVTTTDPRSVTTAYEYDAAGRLTRYHSPNANVTNVYDAAGRRISMTDPTGSTTFTYDEVGRLTGVAAPAGTMTYAYDLAGQQISMTQPEGTISYAYDALGFLSSLTDWTGAVSTTQYDADGRLLSFQRPNGIETTYGYDAAGRTTSVAHSDSVGPIADYTYSLDGVGNRRSMTVAAGGGSRSELYEYDAVDRLTGVDYGDGVGEQFTYDAAGNRVERVILGGPAPGTTTYGYDAAQQMTSVTDPLGSRSLLYDPAGNLLDDGGGATYEWDDQNRLSEASVGPIQQSYLYDGDGLRVSVDGTAQLWDRTAGLPQVVSDGDHGYVHLGGQLLSDHSSAGVAYPLQDVLGSVRGLTNATGNVTGTAEYTAFGAVRSQTGASSAFGFASEQTDPTGLSYLRARMYDPLSGRFLSPDSVQPNAPGTQGWNLYGYANSNPTTFIDPSGHSVIAEYGSLLRNSIVTQVALRALGLCIKGILEGVAMELFFASLIGYEYQFDWRWALVDCTVEIIFGGFGPNGPHGPRPPRPDAPNPKPHPPKPKTPDAPPRPRDPDSPNPRPRDPDTPNRPRDPNTPCNSFDSATRVVLADGSTIPISEVETGDTVWAADPVTGVAGPRLVTAVLVHTDDDELVDLVIDGATLTATDHHPFWSVDLHRWIEAELLMPGDRVLTDAGEEVVIESTVKRASNGTVVYNLSVEDLHTFFVASGDEHVLVHNSGGASCPTGPKGNRPFGSGKPPHEADVTVTRNGEVVSNQPYKSGNMTPEEAALGFPQNSLATHTENRAVRNTPLQPGDHMTINGQYPPCNSCKGAMNRAARDSGAEITYNWPGGSWTANGG